MSLSSPLDINEEKFPRGEFKDVNSSDTTWRNGSLPRGFQTPREGWKRREIFLQSPFGASCPPQIRAYPRHLVLTQHGEQTGACGRLLFVLCFIRQRLREAAGHSQPETGRKHVDVHHAYVVVHLQQNPAGSECQHLLPTGREPPVFLGESSGFM